MDDAGEPLLELKDIRRTYLTGEIGIMTYIVRGEVD